MPMTIQEAVQNLTALEVAEAVQAGIDEAVKQAGGDRVPVHPALLDTYKALGCDVSGLRRLGNLSLSDG